MDLPDEVLDDILRRVPPRHLAACRRVCKNWRIVIDGRGLVLTYLAPRPPHGIFINFFRKQNPSFFSRDDRTSPCISSTLRFLPAWGMSYNSWVLDHHNGLVLYANYNTMYVCNPVTRRWATLPDPPQKTFLYTHLYLVFDPVVSLHYHVLHFPAVPQRPKPPYHPRKKHGKGPSRREVYTFMDIENLPPSLKSKYEHEVSSVGLTEWPPYSYTVQVFSSRTGQWQERHFTREGNAAVTVGDVWSDPHAPTGTSVLRYHAVYWRGELYLHSRVNFIMRLSLLHEKYQVIKTPTFHNFLGEPRLRNNDEYKEPFGYFGKSKQGIYYTAVDGYRLSVWVLLEASETCRTLEWELRHQADLEPSFLRHYNEHPRGEEIGNSWTLDPHDQEGSSDREEDHGWDSSDDNVVDTGEGINSMEGGDINCYYHGMDFLGYHPDKEIVFLGSLYNGFAYYLGTSKLQYLGSLNPNEHHIRPRAAPTLESFVFTPCVDDLLPAHDDP